LGIPTGQPPPAPTPFPYTTLFRSRRQGRDDAPGPRRRHAHDAEERRERNLLSPGQPPGLARAVELDVIDALFGKIVGQRASQRRSEEHTSELQSLAYLVCRLLLV